MKKIATLFTLSLILGAYSSHAQTNMFWDVNGTTAGLGGTGTWSQSGATWATNNSTGTASVGSGAWVASNSNFAYFQGTAGTVTVGASVYMNQMYVNTDGYTFTQSSTSANRYIYTTNTNAAIILADGITVNLSSVAVGYNSGALGIVGSVTNTGSVTSSIAITGNSGTTAGSGIRVLSRVGTNGTAGTNFWHVNLNIKTTGTGGAILGTADSGSWLVLRNPVTVDNTSRLILSPGRDSTRTIIVSNSIITSAADALAIGETGNIGLVVLRHSNNVITGNLNVIGQLGYQGSLNALGTARVVLNQGSTFGQSGTISGSSETITNRITIQGDTTFGGLANSCYFGGDIDLAGGTRTITMANSTVLSGAMTNGSFVYTNNSAARSMTFNGSLNLTNLSILGRGTTTLGAVNVISNMVISNSLGYVVMTATGSTIGSISVNSGSLAAADLGNGTKNLTLTGVGATATFSNTATSGSLGVGPLTLGGSNNFVMATSGSTSVTSSGAITLSGSGNVITLNGSVLAAGQTYAIFTGTSVSTNGLTGPVTLTGTGVNNAVNLTLDGGPITSGANIYTFRSTATALELQVDQNLTLDYSWSGGATGNWNTDPANSVWTLGGSSSAFTSNGNAAIDTTSGSIGLTVDAGGVAAGYVNVTGGSSATLDGGNLSALGLSTTGTALTVNNAVTATNFSVTNSSVSGSGSISTVGGTTVQCDTDQSLSVAFTGTGGVTKSGAGTLTVSGGGNYTGNLVVNSGALATSGSSAIPDNATLVLSNLATLNLGGNETVGALFAAFGSTNNLGAYTLTAGGNNQSYTNGALTLGSGGIVKNGQGIMYMNQSSSTYSGGFTLNNGEVVYTSSGSAGADGVVTNSVFGTGTLTLNGGTIRSSSDTGGRNIFNDVVINQNVTFGSNGFAGTITFNKDANKTTTITKDLTITTVAPVSWEQPISGTGLTLTKAGTNELTLRGNTTLGTLSLLQGNLIVRSTNNFSAVLVGSGAGLGYGGTNMSASGHFGNCDLILSNGASLGQAATNGGNTEPERWMTNRIVLLGNANFGLGNFSSYFTGDVDLTGGTRTVAITNSTYLLGRVTNGGLIISNTSASRTLYLSGPNSYDGGTSLNGGWLSLGNNNALGTGSLTVNPGSTNSTLAATDGLTITNSVSLTGNVALTIDSGSTNAAFTIWTQGGAITGTGSLVKTGLGTLRLAGLLSYSGATTVTNGILVVAKSDLSATISNNLVQVTFSNTPANGTYAILPGALTGTYTLTNTTASSTQKVTLSTASPASVTVASKASQTISGLASTDTKTYGASAYTLSVAKGASTSSLTFASDNTGVATVSTAGLVTIVGAGSTTIRVNQAGDDNYLAATEVTQVLTVAKATPSITAAPTASAITAGQALSASTLSGGTASVGGGFAWTSPSTVPSSTGSFSVTFTPTDSANYNTATTNVSVTVNSAGPTFAGAYAGKNLSDVAPNGLTYLVNYAFGGSDTTEPKLPVQDSADSTKLALVAYVRIGDSSLSVGGQAASSLDFSSPSSATYEVITPSDAPAGMEKRRYSVGVSGDRQFLRLIVTKQ